MKKIYLIIALLSLGSTSFAEKSGYVTRRDIHYYSDSANKADDYINERCVLDICYPESVKGFPTVVWFHGGGLTSGEKYLPTALLDQGLCVVAVNYRLSPRVSSAECVSDAAAAIAWVFNNIKDYGGDESLIFVSGHSAGGYLTLMTGLDKRWLGTYGIDANRIAGLIPLSAQAITHFLVRKEKGMPETQPLIDDMAPLFHVRGDAPPLLLITGDRELEMLGRYEENAYLMRMMKVAGHKETLLYELDGYGHNMTAPAFPLLLGAVKHRAAEIKQKESGK